MECKEKVGDLDVEDDAREKLQEFLEVNKKNCKSPKITSQKTQKTLIKSEPNEYEMASNIEKSRNNFDKESQIASNNLKDKLSNLNKKFSALNIKEKFKKLTPKNSEGESEDLNIEEELEETNDCEGIGEKLSVMKKIEVSEISEKIFSLSLTEKDDCSIKLEEPHLKDEGLTDNNSGEMLSNERLLIFSRKKSNNNNSNAKCILLVQTGREKHLESIVPKAEENRSSLSTEKDSGLLDGVEKVSLLIARGRDDKILKFRNDVRAKKYDSTHRTHSTRSTNSQTQSVLSFENQGYTNQYEQSQALNQETNWMLSGNARTCNRIIHIEDYPIRNSIPKDIFQFVGGNSSESVSIDEITPTVQNFSSDSYPRGDLSTESLELFSEVPQTAWSYSNEIRSPQIPHYIHGSSTATQDTESSLDLFHTDNFNDKLKDIPRRYSTPSTSSDDSISGEDFFLGYESEAIVPDGPNSFESVSIDKITPTVHNFLSDSHQRGDPSTESLELFPEVLQTAWSSSNEIKSPHVKVVPHYTHSSSSTITQSPDSESLLNLFPSDSFVDASNDIPKRYSTPFTSSDHSISGEKNFPGYESEAIVPDGSLDLNSHIEKPVPVHDNTWLPVLSGNDTKEFFDSLSKTIPSQISIERDSEQNKATLFQQKVEEKQFLEGRFENASICNGTNGVVSSRNYFPLSLSPQTECESNDSSISSSFSELNPFLLSPLRSKISYVVKNTLKEPSTFAPNPEVTQPPMHQSSSQVNGVSPSEKPLKSLDNNQRVGIISRSSYERITNLHSGETSSKRTSVQGSKTSQHSSTGTMKPIGFWLKTSSQNKLVNTPLFTNVNRYTGIQKYQAECDRFEREIQEQNLGTDSNKIIHQLVKNRRTNYQGTNLHIALKDLNIVRFYVILEKHKMCHKNISEVNARDSDGKTVYDIAKELEEKNIEFMDLVVKYLEENCAVEGMKKKKDQRRFAKKK